MFCKKCGTQIGTTTTFCPKCGTPNNAAASQPSEVNLGAMPAQDVPAVNAATYTVESVNNQKPFFKKYWGFFAAGAAVLAIGVGVGVYYINALKSGPIAAFGTAMENLNEDSQDIKSGVLTMEMDGMFDAEFQFSVDPKAKAMYMYGDFEITDDYYAMDMEMAMCVEDDEAYMCMSYMDEYEVVDMSDYMDPADIWESYGKEAEEMDWQGMLEEYDLDRELEDYIDTDEINNIVKNFVDSLKSDSNREKIEEAMQFTTTKENGGKTYSVVMTPESLVNTADVFVALFEEVAGDYVEGDWLEDAKEGLEEAREEAEDEDILDEELLEFSYSVKNDRFTNITFASGSYMEDEMGELQAVVDFTYDGKKLNGMEMTMEVDIEGDGGSISAGLTEINSLDDVKGSIPEEMLEEMDMD